MIKKTYIMFIFIFIFLNLYGYANSESPSNVNKNGWKFLTWGMTINETDNLLVKNGMTKLKFLDPKPIFYRDKQICWSRDISDDCFTFDSKESKIAVSSYKDDSGGFTFFFINQKLMAVRIYYTAEDHNAIVAQLKKDYLKGEAENNKIEGPNQVPIYAMNAFPPFLYRDNNLIISVQVKGWPNNSSGELWYFNPEAKKNEDDMKKLEEQRQEEEAKNRVKKIF